MAVFTILLLEDFATCPRQSIKEFNLSLLLGSSSWKLDNKVNIYFSIILL